MIEALSIAFTCIVNDSSKQLFSMGKNLEKTEPSPRLCVYIFRNDQPFRS